MKVLEESESSMELSYVFTRHLELAESFSALLRLLQEIILDRSTSSQDFCSSFCSRLRLDNDRKRLLSMS